MLPSHANAFIFKLVNFRFDNNEDIDCQFDGKVCTATVAIEWIVIECTAHSIKIPNKYILTNEHSVN